MDTAFETRQEQARRSTAELGAQALLVTHLPNVFYLCGFTGSNAALLLLPDSVHMFTDSRYTLQARQQAQVSRVHIDRRSVAEQAGRVLRTRKGGKPLTVALESAHISLQESSLLKAAAGARTRWKPAVGLVEALREIKSPAELQAIRDAAKLGSEVMAEAISLIRPGVSELDLAAEIDYKMRRKGASGPSFETLVASGPRSALIHGTPTEKRLQKKELVVLDLGVILRHYCSDLTRTVFIGRAPSEIKRWYKAVEQAQQAALETVRAGVEAGQVDRAARLVLDRSRLGAYFLHSTGHGLGIEVHEPPRLGKRQKQKIRAGSVITIEPGIYIEGAGGIRIEDDVAVHATSVEVLTSAPRGLLEL
jgi:Xaa-Pro aminopeptidase